MVAGGTAPEEMRACAGVRVVRRESGDGVRRRCDGVGSGECGGDDVCGGCDGDCGDDWSCGWRTNDVKSGSCVRRCGCVSEKEEGEIQMTDGDLLCLDNTSSCWEGSWGQALTLAAGERRVSRGRSSFVCETQD